MNPSSNIHAVIFDFDGVVVDSEKYWYSLEREAFSTLIPNWSDTDQDRLVGMTIRGTYDLLRDEYGLDRSFEEYMTVGREIGNNVYQQCSLFTGLTDALTALEAEGIQSSICSSSRYEWIGLTLERCAVTEQFTTITSADDLGERPGKPAPDIYEIAATKINTDPRECIAIEDAQNGIISAKGAGMQTIGFRNGLNERQDLSEADTEITDLREILTVLRK